MVQRKYGWRPDLPSIRKCSFSITEAHREAAALAPSVDLRAGMPAIWDQGQLGSCFDPETEVLTKEGWSAFKSLSGEEELASVDPVSKQLIFEKPVRLIAKPYKGDMYYGVHEALDFAVTADHSMLVRKWDESRRTLSDEYSFTPMKNIGWYAGVLNQINYSGDGINSEYVVLKGVDCKLKSQRSNLKIPMKTWLEFLGIYIAEGTMLRSYAGIRNNKDGTTAVTEKGANKIQIAASKEREKSFVRQLLTDMGLNFCELSDRFTFQNKRIFSAMRCLGLFGVKASQKRVPEFVFRLPSAQIRHFLEGHFNGDGCDQDGSRSHYTSSERLSDDLQRLIFLSGQWGNVFTRQPRRSQMKDGRIVIGKHAEHRVSVWKSRNLSINREDNIEIKPYDGMVYCAEVPTFHTLVTRRNGKILVTGNCTAHAAAAAVEFLQKKVKPVWDFMPSRLFIYWNERFMEGTVESDSGAAISTSVAALQKYGVPREDMWVYDTAKFTAKPRVAAYTDAVKHEALKALTLSQDVNSLRSVLAGGLPFIFGFTVYQSFEGQQTATTGEMEMPKASDSMLGGHAVCAVGYDANHKNLDGSVGAFLVRNSWGTGWGYQGSGYFWMPDSYISNTNLADDFHVLQELTN